MGDQTQKHKDESHLELNLDEIGGNNRPLQIPTEHQDLHDEEHIVHPAPPFHQPEKPSSARTPRRGKKRGECTRIALPLPIQLDIMLEECRVMQRQMHGGRRVSLQDLLIGILGKEIPKLHKKFRTKIDEK